MGHQTRRWLTAAATSRGDHMLCNLAEARSVVRLAGDNLTHFMQGLITNDIAALNASSPLYSCILNAQGRFLHDMFLHQTSSPNEPLTILMDVDITGKDDLLRLLKRYRLREKIDIDDVSADYTVWVRFGSSTAENVASSPIAHLDSWPADPRLPELGQRAILAADYTPSADQHTAPWQAYRQWRIEQGVAEGDAEIPSGDAVALEYNIDGLNGISFNKGCYVGQELMARTHFKGVVRKRVMPFEVVEGSVQSGDAVRARLNGGKAVGTVRVIHGNKGMAHLRLKEGLKAVEDGVPLSTNGGLMLPWRPRWWPSSWGLEG